MADLYGFGDQNIKTPLTADKATINWGGIVTGAIQIAVSYAQQVNRRRTIGNKDAVIWAAMPSGQITIQRLMTTDAAGLFSSPGWKATTPGTITLSLGGGTAGAGGPTFTATGCVVSQFSVQAEAESLTVMDNVVIEFLQLTAG
jgi:Na+/glutamate symporter